MLLAIVFTAGFATASYVDAPLVVEPAWDLERHAEWRTTATYEPLSKPDSAEAQPAPTKAAGMRFKAATTPFFNDPEYLNQWHLDSTGQLGAALTAGMSASSIWPAIAGATNPPVIGVIDSGIALEHEDLTGALWINPAEIAGNGVDDDANGYVDDIHGWNVFDDNNDLADVDWSGTAIAALAAAVADNGVGVASVAPGAKIATCKIVSADGMYFTPWGIAECMEYFAALADAGVNMTSVVQMVDTHSIQPELETRLFDAIEALAKRDVLYITAADFFPDPLGYSICEYVNDGCHRALAHSGYPNILHVSATTQNGWLMGEVVSGDRTVHALAPGKRVLTALPGHLRTDMAGTYFHGDLSSTDGWSISPGFEVTTDPADPTNHVLLSSPTTRAGLPANTEIYVELPSIDLSGHESEALSVSWRYQWHDFGVYNYGVEDFMSIQIYSHEEDRWLGMSSGNELEAFSWRNAELEIRPWRLQETKPDGSPASSDMRIRLRVSLGSSYDVESPSTLIVDDFAVGPVSSGPDNNYGYVTGTLPAAALVAGMDAALRMARPDLGMAGSRNLIIASGQSVESWLDWPPSISGRHAAFTTADGTGAIECSGLRIQRTAVPTPFRDAFVFPGEPLPVGVQSNECETPLEPPALVVPEEELELALQDNGEGSDLLPDDGVHSAEVIPTRRGHFTVHFPDVSRHFVAVEHMDFEQLSEPEWIEVADGYLQEDEVPFSPWLLGVQMPVESASDIARYISFSSPRGTGPKFASIGILALHSLSNIGLGCRDTVYAVDGEAPRRRWIIEWRPDEYYPCGVTDRVQLVLSEASPVIQVNYKPDPAATESLPEDAAIGYVAGDDYAVAVPDLTAGDASFVMMPRFERNLAPVASEASVSRTVQAGAQFTIATADLFQDGDGDPLTYALADAPSGVSVDEAGVISGSVNSGTHTMTLQASDPAGIAASVKITVSAVAAPGVGSGSGGGGGGAAGFFALATGLALAISRRRRAGVVLDMPA